MIRARCFLAMILLAACSSRGGGTDPPPPPVDSGGIDAPPVDDVTDPGDVGLDRRPPRDVAGCDVRSTREDTLRECMDGIDNDCNGFVDCDDNNCKTCAVPACIMNNSVRTRDGGTCMCMGAEDSTAACSDGIDNDCNGFVDCQDFGCNSCSVTVCQHDGGITTGDGGVCTCRGTSESTNAECMDGLDNDCNGFADCNDFSCSRSDGGVVTVCGTDAGARDSSTPRDAARCADAATAIEGTAEVCNDGLDNDCNGFADCNDRNCYCVGTCMGSVAGCTCRGLENTNAACTDGIDNDCDGFIDCNGVGSARSDFSCTMSPAVTVCARDGGAD